MPMPYSTRHAIPTRAPAHGNSESRRRAARSTVATEGLQLLNPLSDGDRPLPRRATARDDRRWVPRALSPGARASGPISLACSSQRSHRLVKVGACPRASPSKQRPRRRQIVVYHPAPSQATITSNFVTTCDGGTDLAADGRVTMNGNRIGYRALSALLPFGRTVCVDAVMLS
jgi:hypothetical protein